MKIFLTHSYFYRYDPKQWNNRTPYPPLATITALAVLRKENYETEFHDVALEASPANCIALFLSSDSEVLVVYEDGFNYLTKMCLTNMRHACFEMIKAAKGAGKKVIVSGSDSTDHYEMYLSEGADYILHGEGEMALLEVLNSLQNEGDPSEITGISFKKGDTVQKNPPRINLKDLDVIPNAAWDAIDVEAYRQMWKESKFPFTLNIATTRGCPFKCNWCAKPIYGNRYNSRSPERVVEEISVLYHAHGVRHFWMTDDIFGLKPGWVKRFSELVKEAGLDIRYKIQSRADLLLQDATIEELADSGLEEAWIGAESGSQKILDAMDKGTRVEQIDQSTKLLQSKGVRIAYFLQFGYLGETKEDIDLTVNMLRRNRPDDIGISVSYPLPGTPFFETVKAQMGSKSNWVDSDDLDLMFKGTYSSDFYRLLQRYVHHLFRLQIGWDRLIGRKKQVSMRYVWLLPYNLCLYLWMGLQLRFKK